MIAKVFFQFLLYILIGVVILGTIYLVNLYFPQNNSLDLQPQFNESHFKECEVLGGKFLNQTNECEGITQEQCDLLGGIYDECASACRNNIEAEVCTANCVQVCSFS